MIISGDAARKYINEHCEHFTPQEFDCKCGCGALALDTDLVQVLNHVRKLLGRPLVINSGFRCPKHNKDIKGATFSPHMLGCAVDVKAISSTTRFSILRALLVCGIRRIGIGDTFIHFDTAQGDRYAQDVLWTYYPKTQGGES